jgi:hypothetical protein
MIIVLYSVVGIVIENKETDNEISCLIARLYSLSNRNKFKLQSI